MASATVRDALEKAQDVASNTVADIKPHANRLQSDLSGYKEEIMSAVGNAYESGKRGANSAMDGAGRLYESARDSTMSGVKSAARTVKAHPVTTVAIAAGVGLLVGAFLMWRR